MSTRAVTFDTRPSRPPEADAAVPSVAEREGRRVATASDEDVLKVIRRITRDHEALIKALSK